MNTLSDTDEGFAISKLNPEDVRDKPNGRYSPWVLAVTHLALLMAGIMQIRVGLITESLGWMALPWGMWVWGLWGLGLGVAWFAIDGVRSEARHDIPLYCILKQQAHLHLLGVLRDQAPAAGLLPRFGAWPGRAIQALFVVGVATTLLLSGVHRNLAVGAFAMGFVVGALPSYVHFIRRWNRSWDIIRQVKAKQEGEG